MSDSPTSHVLTPAQAKAELLAWADATDQESARSGSGFTAMAVKGGLVVAAGIVVGRLLSGSRRRAPEPMGTGKRLISMALLAKAGAWLLPHALRWIQTPKKPSSGGAEPARSSEGPPATGVSPEPGSSQVQAPVPAR